MWEAITNLLTNQNTWMLLLFVIVLFVLIIISVKKGLIKVDSQNVKLGGDDKEREIIRHQTEWAYLYIMALRNKFSLSDSPFQGYLAKYVLEKVYDEVVKWITFNHITDTETYISIKKKKIESLVYNMEDVRSEFRTPEFKERIDNWTEEVIKELVQIRKAYK